MEKEMISIIIPVYNVEQYIAEAIESVLQQPYENWELILIDDGSVDESLQVCRKYANEDRRIKVYAKENGGVSSARNKGIELSCGEWLLFMDADDRISSDCLEVILKYIEDDIDILNWNYMFDTDGVIDKRIKMFPQLYDDNNPEELAKYVFFPQYDIQKHNRNLGPIRGAWSKLIKSDLIKNNRIVFDENLKIGEDALFCAMCYQKAKKVRFINEYLYYYRNEITSANRRYREDIEEVFIALLQSAFLFLESYIGEIEVDTCYVGLTYDCVARALEKKFANQENPAGLFTRLKQIHSFICTPSIQKAFDVKFDWSVFKTKQKAIIIFVKLKWSFGLYILQKLKVLLKKDSELYEQ